MKFVAEGLVKKQLKSQFVTNIWVWSKYQVSSIIYFLFSCHSELRSSEARPELGRRESPIFEETSQESEILLSLRLLTPSGILRENDTGEINENRSCNR